jgi:hypothetical protein
MEQERAVAVYSDVNDYQSYEVGFVDYVDENELVLRCLTPKGEPDGRRALRTEDVIRIDADNAYIRKLELLYEYRDRVFDSDFPEMPKASALHLRGQLEFARDRQLVVHLVDHEDYGPSGFVRDVGPDFVDIDRLGPNGEPDGSATLLISSISKVHIGRKQDQVLAFLFRYNDGFRRLLES